MHDGMGGASGVLPAHIKRITPVQLQAWWLAPMDAMRKAMPTAQQTTGQQPATAGTDRAGPMTYAAFRQAFEPTFPGKPDEWWATKHAEWNEEAKNG